MSARPPHGARPRYLLAERSCRSPVNPTSERLISLRHLEDSAKSAQIVAEKLDEEGLFCQIKRVESRKAFVDAIDNKEWGEWDMIREGGILLANLGIPIPLHERISLQLKVGPERCYGRRGKVVRTAASGRISVKFEGLSPAERDALRQPVASEGGAGLACTTQS